MTQLPHRFKITQHIILLFTLWSVVILALVSFNIYRLQQVTRDIAIREARSNFNKDQAIRSWSTTHGGVYVPIDASTPPNPHLSHIPERDLTSLAGKKLTLMNPAYMIRQMNEKFAEEYGVKGHITSLKPLRPGPSRGCSSSSDIVCLLVWLGPVPAVTRQSNQPYDVPCL
jgi:hypothetical protein